MVFPQMVIDVLARLERFDVDFDIPDAFIPEFPPAMFLQERPELGDVSRAEVVTLDNFDRLFPGHLDAHGTRWAPIVGYAVCAGGVQFDQ